MFLFGRAKNRCGFDYLTFGDILSIYLPVLLKYRLNIYCPTEAC